MKLLNCLVGLLFMLIFSFNFVYATTYEDYNCTYPNDCALTTNYPICLNGKCRQCAPELRHKDCQCPPGDYCISDVGDVSLLLSSCTIITNLIYNMIINEIKSNNE